MRISYRKNLLKVLVSQAAANQVFSTVLEIVEVVRIANETFLQGVKTIVRNLLTSLDTSNVGRHRIIMSIKILGIITAVFKVN